MAKEQAKICVLQKHIPKKVSTILRDHPTIEKDTEDFAEENNVGADAWRLTGLLTFDGNRKSGPKVTFKKIQEHLQQKYECKISYGSVVQLCTVKHTRRLSAKRYKGVARVSCRQARKGFNIKYNPDACWSTAFYENLEAVQLLYGADEVVIKGDDQAGFRLDTTFTHCHKKSVALHQQPILTTCTDFVNPYTSIIQTTSYLFMEMQIKQILLLA